MNYLALVSKLRTRREKLVLTQADVALHLGIDRTTVCNFEAGRRCPSVHMFIAWAGALDLEVELLDV